MVKKLLIALIAVLVFSGAAFAWGTGGGDGSDVGQLQETAVFFNNSGKQLLTGVVVVLDLTGSGVTTGTTLGAYVTTTATADSRLVMGVVKVQALNQTPVVVITKGPADTQFNSADNPYVGDSVGTSTVAGKAGAGTRLGVLLEGLSHTDGRFIEAWIWVDPHNSE